MIDLMEIAMLRDKSAESADSTVVEQIRIQDLNEESIYRYRNIFKNKKPSHVWNNLSNEEFLIKIGAAKKGIKEGIHPTRAGLLFFGNYITIIDEFPDFFLDFKEKNLSDTRWTDRVCSSDGYWSGNIFDFYFKIVDRVTGDVKKPFKLDEKLFRIDETPIHGALREALVNALIHADYLGRCGVVIEKTFRKIKISNPGNFRIGVDVAIGGGISDARNPRIFNMFSLIEIGERAGSSLCNLFNVWEENGFTPPLLVEELNPDRIVLELDFRNGNNYYSHEANDANDDANSDVNDINSDTNSTKNDTNDDTNLNVKEKQVLKAIYDNTSISIPSIAREIAISKPTVDRTIKTLKEKGYIQRKGSTRGEWIILK